ncbi:hypothetical protein [Marinitoga lauensis]|uniref:hypothetical protein n=1 Tax=Marinitoga lauensis TaxID=2201189 RepID=UPI001011D141|nr:hypothetical protein [Marinitoga lauensis]
MEKIVLHIYYGSKGTAGLYIKKIVDVLKERKISTQNYVNYYFTFNEAEYSKIFFKYSEKMNRGKLRKIIRFMELIINYIQIYRQIKKYLENMIK